MAQDDAASYLWCSVFLKGALEACAGRDHDTSLAGVNVLQADLCKFSYNLWQFCCCLNTELHAIQYLCQCQLTLLGPLLHKACMYTCKALQNDQQTSHPL